MEADNPQAASASDGAAAAASQSAPETTRFGMDIVSALFDEDASESLKQEPAAPASKPATEATARESAPAVQPVASKPAVETASPPKAAESATKPGEPETPTAPGEPSRGEKARETRESLQADKTALEAAVTAALAERDAAAAELAARNATEATSREAYTRLIGDDAEYERRTRIANRMFDPNYDGVRLTDVEATELSRWAAGREYREPFVADGLSKGQQLAQEILGAKQAQWLEGFSTVAAELQFDPSTAPKDADPAGLIRHAAERVSAPLLERISQLEAEVITANDRAAAAGKPVVTLGGRSGVTVPDDVWDPTQSASRNLDRALWGGSN